MSARRPPTVSATPAALQCIERLAATHGPLLFHASGGCCDGTAPMCFKEGELTILNDRLLGHIGGAPYYMTPHAWALSHDMAFEIDVVPGEGTGFSLDQGTGFSFVIRQCVRPPAA